MNKEYFMSLGLSEEQAEAAAAQHDKAVKIAESTAIDNKNKLLHEKKTIEELLKERDNELSTFRTRQKELEAQAGQDEVLKLFQAGDVKGAKELMSKNLMKDHNESLNSYKTQVEQEKLSYIEQLKAKDSILMEHQFEKNFTEIALKNELFDKSPGALKVLRKLAAEEFEFKDNAFSYKKDSQLINGEKVNPENWLNNIVKNDCPFLFNTVQGAGAHDQGINNTTGKIDDKTYESMSTEQQKEAVRSGKV